jgi:hypothetical protein
MTPEVRPLGSFSYGPTHHLCRGDHGVRIRQLRQQRRPGDEAAGLRARRGDSSRRSLGPPGFGTCARAPIRPLELVVPILRVPVALAPEKRVDGRRALQRHLSRSADLLTQLQSGIGRPLTEVRGSASAPWLRGSGSEESRGIEQVSKMALCHSQRLPTWPRHTVGDCNVPN